MTSPDVIIKSKSKEARTPKPDRGARNNAKSHAMTTKRPVTKKIWTGANTMTPQHGKKKAEPEVVNYINGVPVDVAMPLSAEASPLQRSRDVLPPLRTIKKKQYIAMHDQSPEKQKREAQVYKASVLSAGGRMVGP